MSRLFDLLDKEYAKNADMIRKVSVVGFVFFITLYVYGLYRKTHETDNE